MMFLLSNLKTVLSVSLALAVAYALHSMAMTWAEASKQDALEAQKTLLIESCQKDKAVTESIAHEYENRLADLDARVAAAKRLRSSTKCVSVTNAASLDNGSTAGDGAIGRDAVNVSELIDFGAKAEKYQNQLRSCQDFIRKERE